jgi:hypothetical protein
VAPGHWHPNLPRSRHPASTPSRWLGIRILRQIDEELSDIKIGYGPGKLHWGNPVLIRCVRIRAMSAKETNHLTLTLGIEYRLEQRGVPVSVAGVNRRASVQQQLGNFCRVALGRKMEWSPPLIVWAARIYSRLQELPCACDINIDSCVVKWRSASPIDPRPFFSLWMFC